MNEPEQPTLHFRYDFDERAEFEIEAKGFTHAFVCLPNGKRLSVYFYDPVRLSQEMDGMRENGDVCLGEPGLIVVPSVTLTCLQEAINHLYRTGYFNSLAPCFAVPCRCCGYNTLYAYDKSGIILVDGCTICSVCYWVANPIQSDNPEYENGPGRLSLQAAQANYREFGASDRVFLKSVRPPRPDEMPARFEGD